MDHEKHPDCLIQFAEIKSTHARIESDLERIKGAFFGNGKAGFREDFLRFSDSVHRDIADLKESLKEQDDLIQKMVDEKIADEKAMRTEKIKGYFALGTAVILALINGIVAVGIWRWTGQIP